MKRMVLSLVLMLASMSATSAEWIIRPIPDLKLIGATLQSTDTWIRDGHQYRVHLAVSCFTETDEIVAFIEIPGILFENSVIWVKWDDARWVRTNSLPHPENTALFFVGTRTFFKHLIKKDVQKLSIKTLTSLGEIEADFDFKGMKRPLELFQQHGCTGFDDET